MADGLAGNIVNRYVLHDVITSGSALFQEFSKADLVAFEVPPVTRPQFEHRVLEIVQRIGSNGAGPEVLVVTQPSLRRKTNEALWISKWNLMNHIPFKFHQTCSCKTGNSVEGCHSTCDVGCSKAVDSGPMQFGAYSKHDLTSSC